MKKILVIGAGFVASPLVKHLLDQPNFKVKVASLIFKEAKEIVNNHPRGESKQLDLNDTDALKEEISKTDIVVSIVPYKFHPKIAEMCILYKKPMITTSYVSEEMRKLDAKARDAGILILNELGLDPGIDHMEAMRIIDEVKENGGEVTSFISYCGGLPAPEANTTPFGYKFSWSPIGVLLASKNSARYLKDGKEVVIESEDLFKNYDIVSIEKLGDFEGYPNRDSIPYIDLYKIPETKTMFRGTLRNKGWCHKMQKIVELGLLDEEKKDW
ncbi:MAG: saccharopine dehydrogenase NADP-binding domain-containing protein, partial [Candidatus Aminicenantes bacterium]|nr:saccharopine dehydrogenase NADP-binding domain-containing protein [Candidatus Aminicenantes bacterium]